MASNRLSLLPISIALTLSACATGYIDVPTPTGRAEAIFDNTTSSALGSKFAEICLSHGFLVDDQKPTSVSCSQGVVGMQAAAAYMLLTVNTDNPRAVIRFQMIQSGEKVHVVARLFAQGDARFGGGIRSSELSDIKSINQAQAFLMQAGGHAPSFPYARDTTGEQLH